MAPEILYGHPVLHQSTVLAKSPGLPIVNLAAAPTCRPRAQRSQLPIASLLRTAAGPDPYTAWTYHRIALHAFEDPVMCYSAQIWADYRVYVRQFGAELDIKEFYELF